MIKINTETETVVKKILPYLERRGYDTNIDLDFETGVKITDRYSKGYIDILVTCGKKKPLFLIEAKKYQKHLPLKIGIKQLHTQAQKILMFHLLLLQMV